MSKAPSPTACTTQVLVLSIVLPVLFIFLPVEGVLSEILLGQSASLTGATVTGIRYTAGLLSAIHEVNNKSGGISNRLIKLHTLDDQYSPTKTAENVAQLLADYPEMVSFVGIIGSPTTAAALPLLEAAQIPVIGPFTGSSVFRKTFTPWTINIRSGYDDEALAMLRLFTTVKRYKRISIIYQDDAFGGPAKDALVASMESMKLSITSVHPYTYSEVLVGDYDFASFAEDVWQHRPQGVIIIAVGRFTTPFLGEIYKVMTYPINLAVGSWGTVERAYLKDNGLDPTNFFQTQVMPHPALSTSVIAQEYRAAMTTHSDTDFDYLSIEGYIAGRFTIEALRRTPSLNRSDFVKAIYDTKLFTLGDFLVGPFTSDCLHDPGTAKGRSSLCYCNQGLREVHSMVLTNEYEYELIDELTYPITECYATQDILQYPIAVATLVPANTTASDSALASSAASLINQGLMINTDTNAVAETTPVMVGAENATAQVLHDLGIDTLLFGGIGGMEISTQSDYPIFPIFDTVAAPSLASETFERTQIHLLATLQQQTFVQAAFVIRMTAEAINTAATPAPSYILLSEAAAKLQNDQGLTIEMSVRNALKSEGLGIAGSSAVQTLTYSTTVGAEDASSFFTALGSVAGTANLWVFGLGASGTTAGFDALLDKMEQSLGLNVFLTFNDFSLRYSDLESRYGANSTAEVLTRLRFSTNLPLWTGDGPFASEFQAAFAASTTTNDTSSAVSHPLLYTGYVISRVIQYVLVRTSGDATPTAFLDELYHTSVVSVFGLLLGPFIGVEDCGGFPNSGASAASSGCDACNIGPRSVELYSVYGLMQGNSTNSEQTMRFGECHPEYLQETALSVEEERRWWVLALIVGSLLIAVGVVIAMQIHTRTIANTRDVSNAPTEGEVTILFTDIQDSTNLWSNYTASMALSLDIHHAVIRRCIKAHRGYEVKTAGDAFMIATKTPEAALAIAKDIQLGLMKEEWPQCITQHYMDEEFDDDPEQLQAAARGAVWHGCRVRIGIHTGTPAITLDAVTKGYDYYGTDVNLASRIEAASMGGQILTSQATKDALMDEQGAVKDQGLRWSDQGHILPKGLSKPHAVFTAHVTPGVREFPRLVVTEDARKSTTTDVALAGGSGVLGESGHLRDDSSWRSQTSAHTANTKDEDFSKIVQRIHDQFNGEIPSSVITAAFEDRLQFVQLLLKPLPKMKQAATLETVCQGWRTPYDGSYTTVTLNRLIGRMLPAEKNKLARDTSAVQELHDIANISLPGRSSQSSTTNYHDPTGFGSSIHSPPGLVGSLKSSLTTTPLTSPQNSRSGEGPRTSTGAVFSSGQKAPPRKRGSVSSTTLSESATKYLKPTTPKHTTSSGGEEH